MSNDEALVTCVSTDEEDFPQPAQKYTNATSVEGIQDKYHRARR